MRETPGEATSQAGRAAHFALLGGIEGSLQLLCRYVRSDGALDEFPGPVGAAEAITVKAGDDGGTGGLGCMAARGTGVGIDEVEVAAGGRVVAVAVAVAVAVDDPVVGPVPGTDGAGSRGGREVDESVATVVSSLGADEAAVGGKAIRPGLGVPEVDGVGIAGAEFLDFESVGGGEWHRSPP